VIDRDCNWISPYAADRGVAARVVNYLLNGVGRGVRLRRRERT